MKIRRKLPKPARSGRPAFFVGYSSLPPVSSVLRDWFDLEYGGPLTLRDRTEPGVSSHVSSSMLSATHGPWSATIQLSLSPEEAGVRKEQLGWGHAACGQVIPSTLTPRDATHLVLHAARLARTLTLLTDGTTYDVATQGFLNPSDWKDRPLDVFRASDHVTIEQGEAPEPDRERFFTRGLVKFGLDEMETLRPIGLSARPTMDRMTALADELITRGQTPKVGSIVSLPEIGLSVRILRHHTNNLSGVPVAFREVIWDTEI